MPFRLKEILRCALKEVHRIFSNHWKVKFLGIYPIIDLFTICVEKNAGCAVFQGLRVFQIFLFLW